MSAPIITIYKNGDAFQNGKRLVLNRKEIRSFDAFLDRVTKDTRARVAIRSIRTPSHGHRVSELDKLENGGVYVAVGPERFKKLEYKEISNLPTHKPKLFDQVIKPVVHSRVVVSGRARKVAAAEPLAIKTIFVFRNGDDKHPSFKILLDKRMLHTGMDTILQFVTEKVRLRSGAVKSLYTLDGIEVLEPSQLKSMERYVAVGFGKKFLKMPYNENGSTAITPRRNGAKVKSTTSEPPLRKKRPKPPVKSMSQDHIKSPSKKDKDEFSPAAERPIVRRGGAENPANDEAGSELRLTQDLLNSESILSTKNGNANTSNSNETVRKITPAELPSKKSSKTALVTPSDGKSRDKVEKIPAERKKSQVKKDKLKDDIKKRSSIIQKDQETDGEKEEDKTENEPTLFKATGDQEEKAFTVKDNEETSVERPLDMLPAEEVEEEIEDNERDLPQNENASAEQEPDDIKKPEDGKSSAEQEIADSQNETVEELDTADANENQSKEGKDNLGGEN